MSKVQKFVDRIEHTIKDSQKDLVERSLEIFDEYFESQKEDSEDPSEESAQDYSQDDSKEPETEESESEPEIEQYSNNDAVSATEESEAEPEIEQSSNNEILERLAVIESKQDKVQSDNESRFEGIDKVLENISNYLEAQKEEQKSKQQEMVESKVQENQKEEKQTKASTDAITASLDKNTTNQTRSANKWVKILEAIKDIAWSMLKQYFQYFPLIVTGILAIWLLIQKALKAFWEWVKAPFEAVISAIGDITGKIVDGVRKVIIEYVVEPIGKILDFLELDTSKEEKEMQKVVMEEYEKQGKNWVPGIKLDGTPGSLEEDYFEIMQRRNKMPAQSEGSHDPITGMPLTVMAEPQTNSIQDLPTSVETPTYTEDGSQGTMLAQAGTGSTGVEFYDQPNQEGGALHVNHSSTTVNAVSIYVNKQSTYVNYG